MENKKVLLSIRNLKKYFPVKRSAFSAKPQFVRANDGISLDIYEGETLGVVGESGCGKSTLGRVLLQLYPQTAGTTVYYGRSIEALAPRYVEDTLRRLPKYIGKCRKAEAHYRRLDEECQAHGEDASFSLLERRNNAKSDWDTKLSDVVKIVGGFMAAQDLKRISKALLRQYYTDAALFKQRQELHLLESRLVLATEKETGAAERIRRRMAKTEEKINTLETERTKTLEELAKLQEECRTHPDFAALEAEKDGGIDLSRLKKNEMRFLRQDLQLIFQDPYSSLNPRMTVGQIIGEGLIAHKTFRQGTKQMQDYVLKVMDDCDLAPYMLHRYPHQFSGGQRQRIGIARALAMNPGFIVCDEAVSALDVSIQSQIINLLLELKEKQNLTYMFISHDLSVVKYISDRVAVMYLGNVVELADKNALYSDARHPYTIALLSAIPTTEVDKPDDSIILEGSIPSPINPPSGCKFHTRCFMAQEKCSRVPPETVEVNPGHFVACHFPEKKRNEDGSYTFELKK